MLKKLLANKRMLILIVEVLLVLVGTLIVVLTGDDSGKEGRPGISFGTDKDKDSESSKDDSDDVYNGEGPEVQDTLDESVYTIDGSGDWDKQGNKTDDTQLDETNKEDSNVKGDGDDKEEIDEDILIDDKVWGEPS